VIIKIRIPPFPAELTETEALLAKIEHIRHSAGRYAGRTVINTSAVTA
jgi:hypothetical protein